MNGALYRLGVEHPPEPLDPAESRRWRHTRLRRRLLDGTFLPDLVERLQQHLGSVRRKMTGPPDLSGMFFGTLCRELATLYERPPGTWHEETDRAAGLIGPKGAIQRSGLWASMSRYQSRVIGCREYLIRADTDRAGELTYRAVAPDRVTAVAPVDRPDQPHTIAELRQRDRDWSWDILSVEDLDRPVYQIRKAGAGIDPFDGDLYGDQPDGYPYRTSEGIPVLPYVVHHAEAMTDRLFDPYEWITVVEGAINHSVLLSFWLHQVRDCSWPQRYSIDLEIEGLEVQDADGVSRTLEIVTDPGSLLRLRSVDGSTTAKAGQFAPGGDPEKLLSAVDSYAARMSADAGIGSPAQQRRSGDPRSGYAISLDNEQKRAQQRRFSAPFQLADQRLVALSAILRNRAIGSSYPESGYSVTYAPIPLSSVELTAKREHSLALYDRGLATRLQTYMDLHPGTLEDQALAELAAIDAERGTPTADADAGADAVVVTDPAVAAAPAQNTALNGAQVAQAQAIVVAVLSGQIPRSSGASMLQSFFNLSAESADRILGPGSFAVAVSNDADA